MQKISIWMVLVMLGLSLASCKPDIDPKIKNYLNTPCNGQITSSYQKTSKGWTLIVSCDEGSKTAGAAMREGLKEQVPTSHNAGKILGD